MTHLSFDRLSRHGLTSRQRPKMLVERREGHGRVAARPGADMSAVRGRRRLQELRKLTGDARTSQRSVIQPSVTIEYGLADLAVQRSSGYALRLIDGVAISHTRGNSTPPLSSHLWQSEDGPPRLGRGVPLVRADLSAARAGGRASEAVTPGDPALWELDHPAGCRRDGEAQELRLSCGPAAAEPRASLLCTDTRGGFRKIACSLEAARTVAAAGSMVRPRDSLRSLGTASAVWHAAGEVQIARLSQQMT